jgi:hypothetical protein
MTMQSGALVTDRHMRQPMGGLEGELLEYLQQNSSVLPRQGPVENGGQIIRGWTEVASNSPARTRPGVGDARGTRPYDRGSIGVVGARDWPVPASTTTGFVSQPHPVPYDRPLR